MQQRTTPSLKAVPDPVRDLFYASRIGTAIAAERSGFEGTVVMKLFDLIKVWRSPRWMIAHGMPKLSDYEWRILQHLVLNGRAVNHLQSWTATRGGQHTVNLSLAYETAADYHEVSRAVVRLRKVGLVDVGYVSGRQSITLTEHFHRMMFEVRWRYELRNSHPVGVDDVVAGLGWRWLVTTVDEVFGYSPSLSYTLTVDRKRAVGEAQYRCRNG